jgi:phosphate:Na+ symporter
MKMMTDGLQMSAGDRIKRILSAVSSNRLIGCATGAAVTAMVQSSSAITVMLISFVGAGMMTLQQSIGMILGANVGTTLTAQIIAFKLTEVALPAIAIGVGLKFFSRKRKYRYIGEVILGFGLLFFGMTVMKNGLSPIKDDPNFILFFTRFDPGTLGGLLLCIATGALLTIMVQSSSATVGLTMTLATQGLLDFPAAMALVLGENIGTTITAELATIGASDINSHRAARAHTMFNVLGVTMMICIFPYFVKIVELTTEKLGAGAVDQLINGEAVNVPRYIANGHTTFNVLNALFFLLVLPWLTRVSILLSGKQRDVEIGYTPPQFDNRFIDSTIGALAQVRKEIVQMSELCMKTLLNTVNCLVNKDLKKLKKWKRYEDLLDSYQKEIITYLVLINQGDVNAAEAKEISSLMRMTNNIERIGNIAIMTENIIEEDTIFTPQAVEDIDKISNHVITFLQYVTQGIQHKPDDFMKQAQILEDEIDFLREEMRQEHIKRLSRNQCASEAGLMYSDMLSNFEKMGDYCYNIAEAVAGIK